MNRKKILVYASILFTMLCWSMSYIWIKIVYRCYQPITTVFLRLVIGSAFLFILAKLLNKLQKIQRSDFKLLIPLTLFQPFLYFLCESFGLKYVSPTIASVIISTIPLFTPIVAFYLLNEKLSRLNVIGLLVSFVGVLTVILKRDFSLSASPLGLLLLSLAVAAGVGYTTSVKKLAIKYSPLTIVTYQNILGILWFAPLFLVFDLRHFLNARPTGETIISLLLLALLATSIAFILFAYSVKKLGAARTSMFGNIMPVFTAVFAWLLLDEELSLRMIIGIFVVITGLFISQLKRGTAIQ